MAKEQPTPSAERAQETAEDKVIDLEKVKEEAGADAKMKERAYGMEVRQLCALAGKPALAEDFIKKGTSVEAVRAALLEKRAEESEAEEIVSAHEGAGDAPSVDLHQVSQTAYGKFQEVGK